MKSVQEYDTACSEETWYNLHRYIMISDRACIVLGWFLLVMIFCLLSWVAAENLYLLAKDEQSQDQTRYEIPLVCLVYICGFAALAIFATDLFKASRQLFRSSQVSEEEDGVEYLSSLL